MKKNITLFGILFFLSLLLCVEPADAKKKQRRKAFEQWPNGELVDPWFNNTTRLDVAQLGRQYVITDYGVANDSTILQTNAIQALIDKVSAEGGGVVVIPRGTFLSGALFFKPGTHLHLCEGAVLKAIDAIKYYPIMKTRIEGRTINYFCAFINADGVDNFSITGTGTINGNGLRFWEEFWIRLRYNPNCTNLEAMRYRLVYISNSKNVTLQDVHLINSAFWTTHYYRCERLRLLGLYIYAPHEPSESSAPSSDAVDLDVCQDVLVSGCYISVNDDGVVVKGGKGTWADKAPENGPTSNVMVRNCHFGFVHSCLTFGSESIHDWNVVMKDCQIDNAPCVLRFKMRPDTPQHYEYVTLQNLKGSCGTFIDVTRWMQFFQPGDRPDMPLSQCNNIVVKDIEMECGNFLNAKKSDRYRLKDFTFSHVNISNKAGKVDFEAIENLVADKLVVNGETIVANPHKQ